ncbi:rhodanese-like domain-containing protein [Winogradskyella flava]|uniref:Rhodanese-like domain-containing protein n=1 Tax=Winogradskyella flava TaxID=1884876 RepID=A0A842IN16_9FLAO|nr:rhodanese-like domain-containing protein [Winogradskyella flava]MBC2844380.1 rhodanese-like domain-containing protein [Winogradskyella flava]
MKKNILYIVILFSSIGFAQKSISKLLKKHNTESIPYISVQELAMPDSEAIILDSREIKEYEVSHIKNAIQVGYDNFSIETVEEQITDKSKTIVVYCSVGIRSEDVGEKLKEAGYTNVYNLFGGIFEWKNNDFTVYDNANEPTENVHTFSKEWSKWLLKGIKIYD